MTDDTGHRHAEDGDTDICATCGRTIRFTTADPDVPWVHQDSGNLYCDVRTTTDAVTFSGTPGRPCAFPLSDLSGYADEIRAVTARLIAAAPAGAPVPAIHPEEAEQMLRASRRCWYQTASGLPPVEYCGHPAPHDDPELDQDPATWGMCVRHARQSCGIDDPLICVGDRVYDPDPDADPDWHGTVTYADNNGYGVRWDHQHQDYEADYGQIAPVPDEPSQDVLHARRLAAAVRLDHSCDDPSCDITAALKAGCPQTAAWLLIDTTGEYPCLTWLLHSGGAIVPVYRENCTDWTRWTQANPPADALVAGRSYWITYVCPDSPGGPEGGSGEFIYLGPASADGKHTFTPVIGGPTIYLLLDEITDVLTGGES
jgi:hypothetical protein